MSAQNMATPGGLLLVLAVLVPFVGVLLGLALGGHNTQRVALATLPFGLGIAIALHTRWHGRVKPWSICSGVGRRPLGWLCAQMDCRRSCCRSPP